MSKRVVHAYLDERLGPMVLCGSLTWAARDPVNLTKDPENTTCKRCLAELANQVERRLADASAPKHYVGEGKKSLYQYSCGERRTTDGKGTYHLGSVSCLGCLQVLRDRGSVRAGRGLPRLP